MSRFKEQREYRRQEKSFDKAIKRARKVMTPEQIDQELGPYIDMANEIKSAHRKNQH